MTFTRYLRIWRKLNAITISDIALDLNLPEYKIRRFDLNQNNELILQWYINHGLDMRQYNEVLKKYENKKKKKE